MPQAIVAEVGPARRIVGAVALRTVGGVTGHGHRTHNWSRLIERDERKAGIEGGPGIVSVAISIIAGVIRVVVAVIGGIVAVTVITRRNRRAGRYASRCCANGKAGTASVAATAIAAELSASQHTSVALRELRIAAGKLRITATGKVRISTSGNVAAAHIGLSANARATAHPRATHVPTGHMRTSSTSATVSLLGQHGRRDCE
jgi:hypothetical protein